MFSLNGSLNIKNILIVNLILSLFITLILAIKIGTVETIDAYNTCRHISGKTSYLYNICSKSEIYYYDEKNNKYKTKKEFKKKIIYFEPDSKSYIYNFFLINNATFILKDIKTKIKRLEIENNIFEFQENAALIHIIEGAKKVRNRSLVEPLSNIYTSIFNDHDYSYSFLNLINFVYLIITFIFIYLILQKIFTLKDKKISLLISANICCFPLFLTYYLTFYKEPMILLSFFMILINFFYFIDENKKLSHYIFFSLLLYFSFKLIVLYKSIYLTIYAASLLVSSFILILKLKKIKNKIYILLQYLVITFFAFNYHQEFINKFNFDELILKKEKIYQKVQAEEASFLDKLFLNLMEAYQLKKFVKTDFNEKTALEKLEGFIDTNKNTIIEEQAHLINDPMPEKVEPKIWTTLKCFSLHRLYCQRFNNLFFRIASIKADTYKENLENPNAINKKKYKGTFELLVQVPKSLKGYLMPILFNSNSLVTILSIFKIFISLFVIIALYMLMLMKKKTTVKKIIISLLIFSPFLVIIDLVTSNFFTYHRYVFPFNVYIFIVIYGSLATYFLNEKNQYNNKLGS